MCLTQCVFFNEPSPSKLIKYGVPLKKYGKLDEVGFSAEMQDMCSTHSYLVTLRQSNVATGNPIQVTFP